MSGIEPGVGGVLCLGCLNSKVCLNSHGVVACSVSGQEYSGTSCFLNLGGLAKRASRPSAEQFLDSRVVCAQTPVSRQQFSLASEIIEGNYFRPPPTTAPNSPPRRQPRAPPPPPEAEILERSRANLGPPFPKLRLRDRRNATPSPTTGPHNHKRPWITDAIPAHGLFSMILAAPSPWGYVPVLLAGGPPTPPKR